MSGLKMQRQLSGMFSLELACEFPGALPGRNPLIYQSILNNGSPGDAASTETPGFSPKKELIERSMLKLDS